MSPVPPDPRLRASDSDRDAVAEQLREAHTEGRLTLEELEERLGKAYTARTFADLAPLTADLPLSFSAGTVAPRPATGPARVPPARSQPSGSWVDTGLRAGWYAWATVVGINVMIWLLVTIGTGNWVYFWPAWVAGPWGVVLLVGTLSRRAERGRRPLPPGGPPR
jgi:hypothetical protein